MTIDERLERLEHRVDSLSRSIVQQQKNQSETTSKADSSYGMIPDIEASVGGVADNDRAVIDLAAYADGLEQRIEALEGGK